MIGVDTNILLRFLTADDADQHACTVDFFGRRSPADPAFVSAVALAETIWVLRKAYGYGERDIARAVEMLTSSDDFVVEGCEALQAENGDLVSPIQIADFLIAHLGRRAGCSHTVTFDRYAAGSVAGMELLS